MNPSGSWNIIWCIRKLNTVKPVLGADDSVAHKTLTMYYGLGSEILILNFIFKVFHVVRRVLNRVDFSDIPKVTCCRLLIRRSIHAWFINVLHVRCLRQNSFLCFIFSRTSNTLHLLYKMACLLLNPYSYSLNMTIYLI